MKVLFDIVKGMYIIPTAIIIVFIIIFWPAILFAIVLPEEPYWIIANFLWGCGLVYAYLNNGSN